MKTLIPGQNLVTLNPFCVTLCTENGEPLNHSPILVPAGTEVFYFTKVGETAVLMGCPINLNNKLVLPFWGVAEQLLARCVQSELQFRMGIPQ